jgi:hypothetical protein
MSKKFQVAVDETDHACFARNLASDVANRSDAELAILNVASHKT